MSLMDPHLKLHNIYFFFDRAAAQNHMSNITLKSYNCINGKGYKFQFYLYIGNSYFLNYKQVSGFFQDDAIFIFCN